MKPTCPYCGSDTVLKPDSAVYGRSYGGRVYICRNYPECDAYVGVHRGTERPKGRLADKELRRWKVLAHSTFDPIWKQRYMSRKMAYRLLGDLMGLKEAHIGEFNVEQCREAVEKLNEWKRDHARKPMTEA